MLKSKSKYYYDKLDEESKKIYNSILSAWEARNPNASFKMNPVSKSKDIQKILKYIEIDNPGLFYVDFKRLSVGGFAIMGSVNAKFLYDNNQIDNMEKQFESVISSVLAANDFNSMDNYNKEIALYDYLVKNVSFAFNGSNDETTSITGALLFEKAVCEGYSKTFKLLCDNCGLPSIIVTGTAALPNKQEEHHVWNMVMLDNGFAHVDVTWDSANRGNSETSYDNFNLTDEDAANDHTWNTALLPPCNSSGLNYFIKNELCAADRDEFINIVKSQAQLGKKTISVKLTGREVTHDWMVKATNEAMKGIAGDSQRIGFRYNINRRIASINLS